MRIEYPMANPPFTVGHAPELSYLAQTQRPSSQAIEPYGMYLMPEDPASETLLSAPQPAYADIQQLHHPFDPRPAPYAAQSHYVQPFSDIQDTPVLPMGPPTNTRKRKAPTLRRKAWDPYQDRIKELHITQRLPLWKVKDTIEKEFGFTAE